MRVLIATTADSGHFLPLVPLAEALRDAGHELLVAAPESFAAKVEKTGLTFWPCSDMAPSDDPDSTHGPDAAMSVFADRAPRAMLPGVLAAIDAFQPDLVLREMAELSSMVAAVARSVPQAQVLFSLAVHYSFVEAALPMMAGWASTVGVDPPALRAVSASMPCFSYFPESFDVPASVPHGPIRRLRPITAPAVAPAARADGERPLVYLSFGTVTGHIPAGQAARRDAVTALAGLPIRLVVSLGGATEPEAQVTVDAPVADLRVEPWLPPAEEARLVASADAVVGHGGAGTTLNALRNGKAQVIVPFFGDQPSNGAQVEAAGAGLCVPLVDGQLDAAALISAVSRVLDDPAFSENARVIAKDLDALPPVTEAVAVLEGLV